MGRYRRDGAGGDGRPTPNPTPNHNRKPNPKPNPNPSPSPSPHPHPNPHPNPNQVAAQLAWMARGGYAPAREAGAAQGPPGGVNGGAEGKQKESAVHTWRG